MRINVMTGLHCSEGVMVREVGVSINLQVQLIWGLPVCGQPTIINHQLLLPGRDVSICRNSSKILCISPGGEIGLWPKATFDCFSQVSHPFLSLTTV